MADAGGGKDLMSAAEMKPLLVQSKRKPVSCAVGMTKDKQGVLLLDRKVKPRKLMAELKSRAKGEGVDVDMVSVRFGRVVVDDGTAMFTVNKPAPAALRVRLVEKLRPAGVRKVEIGVDEKLEDEGDEEEADGGEADGGEAGSARGSAGAAGEEAGAAQARAGIGGAEAGGAGMDAGAEGGADGAAGQGGAPAASRAADAGTRPGAGAAAAQTGTGRVPGSGALDKASVPNG